MFLVCEAIARDMEHVPFNASLLKIIHYAYPNGSVHFYAEESHIKHVQDQIDDKLLKLLNWTTIDIPPRKSGFFSRFVADIKKVNFLLQQLSGNDILVITGNASILWALKLLGSKIHKNKNIQVILHGDFYPLTYTRSLRRMISPFYRLSCIKTALILPGYHRIKHIVLEEAVRNSVLKKIPKLKNNIFTLDHPIPTDDYSGECVAFGNHIHFGFLGLATENKGFLKYISVAAEISKKFPDRVKFHFIGRMQKQYNIDTLPELSYLHEIPGKERLSRSEYVRRVNKLHFVCMFFDEAYEYTASGVLLDSIAFGKPVIATKLATFTSLENKYGDIGYLCQPDNISHTIISIISQNDFIRYNKQVGNINKIKSSRSPEALAMQYKEIVNKI